MLAVKDARDTTTSFLSIHFSGDVMNSADPKEFPLRMAAPSRFKLQRIARTGVGILLGAVLAGCAVPPPADDEKSLANDGQPAAAAGAASTPVDDAPRSVRLRPNWRERTWSIDPPAAVEVNKGSVTPYPGEPESGEGVTAYGAGLRPPEDRLANGKQRDRDDEDDDDMEESIPGVLVGKGLASWYGGQFHGRLTANGERFDRGGMTAAHRTLPFGSKVCVLNISTGKTVMVRINDRGPFAPGRVIDLSQAAAQELGIQGLGIKQVELWKLHRNSDSCPDELLTADVDGAVAGKAQASRVGIASVSHTPSKAAARKSTAPARKGGKPAARNAGKGKSKR